jgi:uncharacterized protein YuzE
VCGNVTRRPRASSTDRITYDAKADAAFIYLTEVREGEAEKSTVVDRHLENAAVIAVFNDANQLIGVEVLGASRTLPLEVLAAADEA